MDAGIATVLFGSKAIVRISPGQIRLDARFKPVPAKRPRTPCPCPRQFVLPRHTPQEFQARSCFHSTPEASEDTEAEASLFLASPATGELALRVQGLPLTAGRLPTFLAPTIIRHSQSERHSEAGSNGKGAGGNGGEETHTNSTGGKSEPTVEEQHLEAVHHDETVRPVDAVNAVNTVKGGPSLEEEHLEAVHHDEAVRPVDAVNAVDGGPSLSDLLDRERGGVSEAEELVRDVGPREWGGETASAFRDRAEAMFALGELFAPEWRKVSLKN